MKISIEEFIKTGRFGSVKLGMSKQMIIHILGNPDSNANIGINGDILLYGWYEFFINHEDRLHSIQNDNYDPKIPETFEFSNEKIEIDSWFLNKVENQTIESVAKLLKAKNIDFVAKNYYGRKIIQTGSGVIIDFDEEENDFGVKNLIGIWYWS